MASRSLPAWAGAATRETPAPGVQQAVHHAHWPRRVPHRITPPATSLWFNLEVSARRYPRKAATVFFDQVLTYAQLQAARSGWRPGCTNMGCAPVTG
jgi:predicted HD phosphohydrolase